MKVYFKATLFILTKKEARNEEVYIVIFWLFVVRLQKNTNQHKHTIHLFFDFDHHKIRHSAGRGLKLQYMLLQMTEQSVT